MFANNKDLKREFKFWSIIGEIVPITLEDGLMLEQFKHRLKATLWRDIYTHFN